MAQSLNAISNINLHATRSLLKPNPQLDHALSNSRANHLPEITISPLQGQYLAIQCQLLGAKNVLEIGTLGGYSTIWFASTGAKVTSIEINPRHRDVALENTKGLDVEIILGAALDVLPQLYEEVSRKFDLVFIDADWGEQFEYLQWARKLTRVGGAIYVDNVVREILEDGAMNVEKKETLLSRVGKEEGIAATLVSTISGHKAVDEEKIDGFLLAVVQN